MSLAPEIAFASICVDDPCFGMYLSLWLQIPFQGENNLKKNMISLSGDKEGAGGQLNIVFQGVFLIN